MSFNSTLYDMVTRIRNGQKAHKLKISLKFSVKCINILKVLQEEGYIRGFSKTETGLSVLLKYTNNKPVISNIRYIPDTFSKKYLSKNDIEKISMNLKGSNKGLGLFIISTSKGILSDYKCLENNIGGCLLLQIT